MSMNVVSVINIYYLNLITFLEDLFPLIFIIAKYTPFGTIFP